MTENKNNSVGRPLKYETETKVVSFRVPLSYLAEIKEVVNKHLVKLEK